MSNYSGRANSISGVRLLSTTMRDGGLVGKMANFPQTIEVPASILDIVEWLERTNRELWFVGDDKHAAYLSWIENGPMGMVIGSYIPGSTPVKIAFEGYVTIEEGEPGVLLPFNPMEVDPESQFRELGGLFFVTVEPVDLHNCVLIAEVQDAEPMLIDRAVELIKDLVNYYQMRRVADARRRARESAPAGETVAQYQVLDAIEVPVGERPLIEAPAEFQQPAAPANAEATVQPTRRVRYSGRKAPSMEKKRRLVERWRKVEGQMTQGEFAEECGISERTLRYYIAEVEGTDPT